MTDDMTHPPPPSHTVDTVTEMLLVTCKVSQRIVTNMTPTIWHWHWRYDTDTDDGKDTTMTTGYDAAEDDVTECEL